MFIFVADGEQMAAVDSWGAAAMGVPDRQGTQAYCLWNEAADEI